MSYQNNFNLVQDLLDNNPDQVRFDCPVCGRHKSLAIYKNGSDIAYNCFGATCSLKGRQRQKLTIEDIYSRRSNEQQEKQQYVLPDYFLPGLNREEVRRYLQSVYCFEATVEGKIQVRYDPKQDRAVFLIYENGKLVNATGRALSKGVQPKWYKYGHQNHLLVCGNKDHAIVVEDCASAVRISKWVTGIALLGTTLAQSGIGKLRKYKKVLIGLDRDALKKAIHMQRELEFFADVSTIFLDEDLKNLDDQHCIDLLGKHIDLENVNDT